MNAPPRSISLGVILLAAGASVRLGKPKQLLAWKGQTLLQYVLSQVQSIELPELKEKKIAIVLGAHASSITPSITPALASDVRDTANTLVYNEQWQSGMASSLRCGIKALQEQGDIDALLLCLCDQPFITSAHFEKLLTALMIESKGIVASHYRDTDGVPAVFATKYHSALAALQGDQGARALLKLHADDMLSVDCPEAAWDIDTHEDYITAIERTA